MTNLFHAPAELCDFVNHAVEETDKINKWVENQTNNKIQNLIPEPLSTNTAMVLVNAIYFLGGWKAPFQTEQTQKGATFRSIQSSNGKVDMMCKYEDNVQYGTNGLYKWISLPYENHEYEMTFILPTTDAITAESENQFNKWFSTKIKEGKLMSQTFKSNWEDLATIHIPKFRIEFALELADTLKEAPFNMANPFSLSADFSRMTTSPNAIFISKVVHKAFIEVNEQGTEAAAATAIEEEDGCMCEDEVETKDFIADRPFIYVLHHKASGSILFIGKYNKP